MRGLVLLAVLWLGLAGCASTYERVPPSSLAVTLPDLGGEGITVPVSINGEGPYPFLVDTGASKSALYPRGVAAAKQEWVTRDAVLVSIGSRAVVDAAEVGSLSLGRFSHESWEVVHLPPSSSRRELFGIIGNDILAEYFVVWRADRRELSLWPKNKVRRVDPEGWRSLRLVSKETEVPVPDLLYSRARLNFKLIYVMVDTGADRTFLNWEAVQQNPVLRAIRARQRRQWVVEGAVGSFEPTALVNFRGLRVGETEMCFTETLVSDLDPIDLIGERKVGLMILGADQLKRRSFALDVDRRAMWLSPEGAPRGCGGGRQSPLAQTLLTR
ncbi:aspartyl protease family protein [Parvularcula maris]|uniref:Aspartyl protease family protein n=1 Tax=Parvularcula maris TaxID=2965077 RepID=A0A9X2L6W8_9PROT|nr:aspartyl protease family protein [Parvularcula maris]